MKATSTETKLVGAIEAMSIPVKPEEIKQIVGSKMIPTGNERKLPLHAFILLCLEEFKRQQAYMEVKLEKSFASGE